jgi:ferredoxin
VIPIPVSATLATARYPILEVPVRVSVDQQMCVSSGQCVFTAPSVFDQRDDDGVVVLITADPPISDVDSVREAAMLCPAEAISIDE